MARCLYGGGHPLPPNDPRILNLTIEQIDLDLALERWYQAAKADAIATANGTKSTEAAYDPEYAEYERMIDEEARQAAPGGAAQQSYEEYENETADQWVDVEIDR
jgi:hypothetical protein